jgi:hypothetical protein
MHFKETLFIPDTGNIVQKKLAKPFSYAFSTSVSRV